ncbi:hypothetical protein [Xanthobacter wiegelii]|uniref:hypothetical protein n=1 Tax=Xanthobacter wiegelii TaxID=3119913 RepID=UPI00372A9E15
MIHGVVPSRLYALTKETLMTIMTGEHYCQIDRDLYKKVTVSRRGELIEINAVVYDDLAVIRSEETHCFIEEEISDFSVTKDYIDISTGDGTRRRI